MATFVWIDAHGRMERGMERPDGTPTPDGAMAVPGFLKHYLDKVWDGSAWLSRPRLADPVIVTPPGGGREIVWADPPPGATLEVTDLDAGASLGLVPVEEGVLRVTLPEPATYALELHLPPPWMPVRLTVEVPA